MVKIAAFILAGVSVLMLGLYVTATPPTDAPVASKAHAPLDECFDVSLSELAACRNATIGIPRYYRSPPDQCYDVSIRDAASCRETGKIPTQYNRSPVDECYDVPLRERDTCKEAQEVEAHRDYQGG